MNEPVGWSSGITHEPDQKSRSARRVGLELQLNRFAIEISIIRLLIVVDLLAVGVQHADAPGDLLLAEELALQHTERPGLTRLRARGIIEIAVTTAARPPEERAA